MTQKEAPVQRVSSGGKQLWDRQNIKGGNLQHTPPAQGVTPAARSAV